MKLKINLTFALSMIIMSFILLLPGCSKLDDGGGDIPNIVNPPEEDTDKASVKNNVIELDDIKIDFKENKVSGRKSGFYHYESNDGYFIYIDNAVSAV